MRRQVFSAVLLMSGLAAPLPSRKAHKPSLSRAPLLPSYWTDVWMSRFGRTPRLSSLSSKSPRPGEPTPYSTEVRVVLAGGRLYFGFICRDPEPHKIAVHSMARDDAMKGDDSVSIALDTYGDKRIGYFFQVNAAGARTDGLISGPRPGV